MRRERGLGTQHDPHKSGKKSRPRADLAAVDSLRLADRELGARAIEVEAEVGVLHEAVEEGDVGAADGHNGALAEAAVLEPHGARRPVAQHTPPCSHTACDQSLRGFQSFGCDSTALTSQHPAQLTG